MGEKSARSRCRAGLASTPAGSRRYSTEDGAATIGLRAVDGTVWLSQREIAELFDKDAPSIPGIKHQPVHALVCPGIGIIHLSFA